MPDAQPDPVPAHVLPLLLLGGFRGIVAGMHRELAAQGHPDLRPVHGFALQAVNQGACTVGDLAVATGVSKQAAAKTVAGLHRMGYLRRTANPHDGRSRILQLTPRGAQVLSISEAALRAERQEWSRVLGAQRARELERALVEVVGPAGLAGSLDVAGWLG